MSLVEDFAKDLVIEKSSRSHILMLMGFFGHSGGGKTVTALVAATGLVGPDAKIGIVDTEQKRSGLAGDVLRTLAMQKYGKAPELEAIYMDAPFHPLKYVAAIRKLIASGCKAVVVDSITHSWSGEGGYLDLKEEALTKMAGDNWSKREKCAMAAAARTKPQTHTKLVDAILHANVPIILCFRAKEKTKMEADKEGGGTKLKRDEFTTPIQEESLIFEMLISGECTEDGNGNGGFCRFVGPGCKHTHPNLLDRLPKPNEQFSFSHAEEIARWCAAPGTKVSPKDKNALLAELRTITEPIHGWNASMPKTAWAPAKVFLEKWLAERGIIGAATSLAELDADRLSEVIIETKSALILK